MKNVDHLSKIKRIRGWANWNMLIGIILMYIGYISFAGYFFKWFADIPLLGAISQQLKGSHMTFTIILIIGFLMMMVSTVLYMVSGMVSTTSPQVQCPSCGKVTKMLGKEDACMFCGQPLLLEEDSPEPPSSLEQKIRS
ncbi:MULTISPECIES: DUF2614 family zinc ribbon-containing protein [Brevibacillus]|uniref:DUF2614 family zinc ribbon-containing protein n=1 Tax=Brevibacillus TaxID=55080 RepID=UPI000B9BE529|nr:MULTISPECIES: DUF2614 family zinc ribbon-containing protein [Brevibacillus]MBG9786708.1 membrane protein [Brevibacillus laterosporus]MED1788209.1 DUF2614 family zinc ribbon-containing protein [Brevibacillus laterosporus]RFB31971.1 hypothetical protein DZB91_17415 [Brevibacillus sp. VP]